MPPSLPAPGGVQSVFTLSLPPEANYVMAVTVSLVLLFGLVLFFLLRSNSLGYGSAFIAVMFGFFLASTGAPDPSTNSPPPSSTPSRTCRRTPP